MFKPIELFRIATSEPEAVERMCAAYELVSRRLADDEDRRPTIVSQVLARRIVRVARSGQYDPTLIAENVLNAFGLSEINL